MIFIVHNNMVIFCMRDLLNKIQVHLNSNVILVQSKRIYLEIEPLKQKLHIRQILHFKGSLLGPK